MYFVFIRFLDTLAEWIETGRYPREELRIRWWIAALGVVVILPLLVALVIAAL
jgi:hypothetical protein